MRERNVPSFLSFFFFFFFLDKSNWPKRDQNTSMLRGWGGLAFRVRHTEMFNFSRVNGK